MRLLALVEYSAIAAGAAGIIAGQDFGKPEAVHLGVFLVGAGITIGGLESLLTRTFGFRFAERAAERHSGAPAVVFGLMALLVGAATIWAAYLLADATWASTLGALRRRPGPAYAAAGFLVAGTGLLLVMDAWRREGAAWRLVVGIPETLVGGILLLVGLGSIGAGVWEWYDPHAFARALSEARPLWDATGARAWRGLQRMR